MIIKKLHIENFGKLSNFDIDFNEHLNVLYKENGWGKSTLTAFIKAMFYSMPARSRGDDFKYERPKYFPWQGGKYGGYIEYETDGETYRITRYFEKTPEGDFYELKNLATNKIVTYESERLGDALFGLGRESFEVTALFPQLNFISSSTVQITANLTGLNKFQNDMENISQAIKIIDAKFSGLKKERPKKEELESLKNNILNNENLINEEKTKLEDVKKQLLDFKDSESNLSTQLNEENKQFELLSHSFEKKIALQENLTKQNERLSEVLQASNQLKDEKFSKKGGNGNKKLKYFVLSPSILLTLVMVVVLTLGAIDLLVGLLCIIGFIGLAILSYFALSRARLAKDVKNDLKDLDKQLKDNDEQAKTLQKDINEISNQLKLFAGLNAPDRQKLEGLEDQTTHIKLQRLSCENEIVNITESIDRKIELNEKLQGELDAKNDLICQIDKKMAILKSTRDFLLSAKENVSKRFVVPVNEKLKDILSKFNFSNQEFVVDTSWKVKENTNYGMKDFEYSSQGVQDIISFCQRINLIQEVYQKERPMIILDDTFVNLDDHNMGIAKQIVREISKDYQVLYICCNERCSITT